MTIIFGKSILITIILIQTIAKNQKNRHLFEPYNLPLNSIRRQTIASNATPEQSLSAWSFGFCCQCF